MKTRLREEIGHTKEGEGVERGKKAFDLFYYCELTGERVCNRVILTRKGGFRAAFWSFSFAFAFAFPDETRRLGGRSAFLLIME